MVGDVERVREQWDEPTLKAWCEAFTSNKAWLKEFTMRKEAWGWDFAGLEGAVKSAILSTGYASDALIVSFDLDDRELTVHPDNFLSRVAGQVSVCRFLAITESHSLIRSSNRRASSSSCFASR